MQHSQLKVSSTGFDYDRHWMVVDDQGQFLTQRQQSRMVLIKAGIDADRLRLRAPGMPDLEVDKADGASLLVTVWRDTVRATTVPMASGWLTEFLGQSCQLVSLPLSTIRGVDPVFATVKDQVGFADGFPFLLISQASLDDLNSRLQTPLTMERFRPNLVVSGCEPYQEDSWRRIRIGDISFRVVKPCSRCTIPTINPETGRREDIEPLATLASYRKRDNHVFFGQNLIHDQQGKLSIGMEVEIIE